MLRDNLAGLIEPMLNSAGADPLALCKATEKPSDDRPPCLENPCPEGAESTLTENDASPFHAEPRHECWSSRHRFVNCQYCERLKRAASTTDRVRFMAEYYRDPDHLKPTVANRHCTQASREDECKGLWLLKNSFARN